MSQGTSKKSITNFPYRFLFLATCLIRLDSDRVPVVILLKLLPLLDVPVLVIRIKEIKEGWEDPTPTCILLLFDEFLCLCDRVFNFFFATGFYF